MPDREAAGERDAEGEPEYVYDEDGEADTVTDPPGEGVPELLAIYEVDIAADTDALALTDTVAESRADADGERELRAESETRADTLDDADTDRVTLPETHAVALTVALGKPERDACDAEAVTVDAGDAVACEDHETDTLGPTEAMPEKE